MGEVLSLKEWRLRRYWSIRKLAKEAGVSTDAIMRAEKGQRSYEITQRKIADALSVHPSQIAEFVPPQEDG